MPSEEVLQAAATRLVEALELYRTNPTPPAADRVIEARLAVKEAFIAAGWNPPEATRLQMERDRLLLRQHAGALDDQPPKHRLERTARHRPGRPRPATTRQGRFAPITFRAAIA